MSGKRGQMLIRVIILTTNVSRRKKKSFMNDVYMISLANILKMFLKTN